MKQVKEFFKLPSLRPLQMGYSELKEEKGLPTLKMRLIKNLDL